MNDWTQADDPALLDATRDIDLIDEVMAQLDAHDLEANTRDYSLLASALHYARVWKWPVFPLIPADKRPLTTRGFHDATQDPDQIAFWWRRWPQANIGTPTGPHGCGHDVIDVDRDPTWPDPQMGFQSWAQMLHAGCPPGCCTTIYCPGDQTINIAARAVTPRGGRHIYVPAQNSRNATHIQPGIDLRGTGGYVALAPSIGSNGRRYTWIQRPQTAKT